MKALLAFAIGLVMLASAAIVMGVAVAEEDVQIEDVLLVDEPVVSDEGDGLVIAPAPGTDDGSTDTDDEVTISPGISPTIDTGYDLVQCDDWGFYDELDSPDLGYQEDIMASLQRPSNPSWTFDDITSLPGCPNMFVDMDNIFSDVDTQMHAKSPIWQTEFDPHIIVQDLLWNLYHNYELAPIVDCDDWDLVG